MAVSRFPQETNDKACAASTIDAKGTVQELASSAAQTLQDVASDVSHRAQDWAANVANKAQETASSAVDKTNEGIAAVGQQMNALGGTVRKAAPQEGVIGSAATRVTGACSSGYCPLVRLTRPGLRTNQLARWRCWPTCCPEIQG